MTTGVTTSLAFKMLRFFKDSIVDLMTYRSSHFLVSLRLQLHGAINRPDSFVLTLRHYVNLKAIRYESTSLNRIAANKSHRVIVA